MQQKYTKSGKISLEFKNEALNTHQFILTDTGTGIPVETRERLFKPFAKIRDLTQGNGLGLPTCSLIAYKLNGTLTLDTDYKKGPGLYWNFMYNSVHSHILTWIIHSDNQ